LLFVNCSLLPSFFSCAHVRKSVVWCVYSTFFLFFCYHCLYRTESHYNFFYISKSRRYTRHRMRPVTIDVAWSLCVCLLDTTMSHAKTDEPSRCYLGCGIWLAQRTMPCSSHPVQRGLCVCCVYTTVSYAKTEKPSRCHMGCDIGDKCPFFIVH